MCRRLPTWRTQVQIEDLLQSPFRNTESPFDPPSRKSFELHCCTTGALPTTTSRLAPAAYRISARYLETPLACSACPMQFCSTHRARDFCRPPLLPCWLGFCHSRSFPQSP